MEEWKAVNRMVLTGTLPAERQSRRVRLLIGLAVVVLLAMLGWQRWYGPGLRRPLLHDEFLTLEYYTWAGLEPAGDGRRLRRLDDFHALPAPGALHLAMGVYRSLGVWKEPNNHVLNSLLINFALAWGERREAFVRLPALLGALALACALYWVFGLVLGWIYAAPLLAILGFCFPYVVNFSQTARGHTWMVTLQVLGLGYAYRLVQNPQSLKWGVASALVAILSIWNIAALAVLWVIPLYLALWLTPPRLDGEGHSWPDRQHAVRRSVLVQLMVIGAVGLCMLIDRLPFVYSAVRQYGIPFESWADVGHRAGIVFHYFFPSAGWILFAIFGLAGLAALVASWQHRFLGITAILVLIASCTFSALIGKLLYDRTYGYFIPLYLTGAAFLIEKSLRRLRSASLRATGCGIWALLVLVLIWPSFNQMPEADPRIETLQQLVQEIAPAEESETFFVLPPSGEYILAKYLPSSWLDVQDELPRNGDLQLVLFLERRETPVLEMQEERFERPTLQPIPCLPVHGSQQLGRYQITRFKVQAAPLTPVTGLSGNNFALAIWQPDVKSVGVDASELMSYLGQAHVPYIRQNIRVSTKLDFHSRLDALEFVSCSAAEFTKITELVLSGIHRFGGSCVVLRTVP